MLSLQALENLDTLLNLPLFLFSSLSWACTGHHELWCDQGAACAHHVVAAWSIAEKKWCGKHLHQKSWQVHWQQGSVWHLLCFWQHPVMQGKRLVADTPFLYLTWGSGMISCHYFGIAWVQASFAWVCFVNVLRIVCTNIQINHSADMIMWIVKRLN